MPSWGEIGQEIARAAGTSLSPGVSAFDHVRRSYLVKQRVASDRAVILYATRWTEGGTAGSENLSISYADVHGFMEAMHGVKERKLDLILHSPGGSPEAAEAIVTYLRSKFDHIRVIIPHMAMSAATMIACAADVIVMGRHSFIGPIDPQIQLVTAVGVRMVACQSVLEQFARAQKECSDPARINAWIPMLGQFGPDLLQTCINATVLGKSLVSKWLSENMFKDDPEARQKADTVANWLGTHSNFLTHGRPISREIAKSYGLRIENLEDNSHLQDGILSIYHATSHTFTGTGAVKIIENHFGRAYILQMKQILIGADQAVNEGPAEPPSPPTPSPPPPRSWRRPK